MADDSRLARMLAEIEESWAFRASTHAFLRNSQECLDYLFGMEHMGTDEMLDFSGDLSRQEKVSFEVLRLLGNSVGTAVALDHTVKGLHNRLHRDGSFPEFTAERREKFEHNPPVQFVIRLRDYLVHVKPIPVTFAVSVEDLANLTTSRLTIGIDLDGLCRDAKSWRRKGRDKAAKTYLDDLAAMDPRERPTLFMHILQFRTQVDDFCRWFGMRQRELQKGRLGTG